jgi:plasmid stabilization system protein ParE
MKDYKLKWESDSLKDRKSHFEFLSRNASLDIAERSDNKIVDFAQILKTNPLIGREVSTPKHNGRLLKVRNTPYLIHYIVNELSSTVSVLRVFHDKQAHPH